MGEYVRKLSSISAFFPCYNDGGTIGKMVEAAQGALEMLADDYEIIVVNDGSTDHSAQVLAELSQRMPCLKVITHPKNQGYGAALRSGFAAATKEFIFYTDGDAQYDPREMPLLVQEMEDGVDLVNGYKIARHDPFYRLITGWVYGRITGLLFHLLVRDVNCDFRLMRASVLKSIKLELDGGAICVELVKKMERAGRGIRQVPVHHYARIYGHSQFLHPLRVARLLPELGKLWWQVMLRRECPRIQALPAVHSRVGDD